MGAIRGLGRLRHVALTGAALLALSWGSGAGHAQTVADVRAQLSALNGQVQQLRDQLVQEAAAGGLPVEPATAFARLDQLDAELRRLTARVEVLTNDIDRIVADASNKAGDIEFRLMELEGGAVPATPAPDPAAPDTAAPAAQAAAPQLGGGITTLRPRPRGAAAPAGELTVTEQSDFEAAKSAAEAGDYDAAIALFDSFLVTFPGGPLSTAAQFHRSEALAAKLDWSAAARSYLDVFSGDPDGEFAPQALFGLAVSLGQLGQTPQACLTFAEVDFRYPESGLSGEVASERASLACP